MSNLAVTKRYESMSREQLEEERQKLKEEIAGPSKYTHADSEHSRMVILYKKAIFVEKLLYGDEAAEKLRAELYPNSRYHPLTPEQKLEKEINKDMAEIEMRDYVSNRTVCKHNPLFYHNGREKNGRDDF